LFPDVQQNVKTVSSLLQAAEEKYAASQVLIQPEVRNEEGLPLTEIHEELDEEGNVICTLAALQLFLRY
jgi:unconventional prefoldin RPB5 interactor 1